MSEAGVSIACFGEILWDVFPDRSLLGGAPLNVAMRLHSLGANVTVISSLGKDQLGADAISEIEKQGLSTDCINTHDSLPTGSVSVNLKEGIASYKIAQPVAWDEISAGTTAISEIRKADALVFGSLAMRSDYNLNVLLELSKNARQLVFDINLRPPFYDEMLIEKLIYMADFLKMNEEELDFVAKLFSIEESRDVDKVRVLSGKSATPSICVTMGSRGAILFHKEQVHRHPGYQVKVADTVGAGDSFLAGLLFGLYSGKSAQNSLDLACALGGLVASKPGANCEVSPEEISSIRR